MAVETKNPRLGDPSQFITDEEINASDYENIVKSSQSLYARGGMKIGGRVATDDYNDTLYKQADNFQWGFPTRFVTDTEDQVIVRCKMRVSGPMEGRLTIDRINSDQTITLIGQSTASGDSTILTIDVQVTKDDVSDGGVASNGTVLIRCEVEYRTTDTGAQSAYNGHVTYAKFLTTSEIPQRT